MMKWLAILCMALAPAPPPPQPGPLDDIQIRGEWLQRLDKIAWTAHRNKARYVAIQRQRPGGVPWFVVAGLHERESSSSWRHHLHEGSPLLHRTRYIPRGRLPSPKDPPYTFEQSAEDALYILKREDRVNWRSRPAAEDAIERFNGLGYRNRGLPSPYLWSGTTRYSRGKYVADGKFSSIVIDKQPGVMAIWKRLAERGML